MRRLPHTAILLGFTAPVAGAAGLVAFYVLAAAPVPAPLSGMMMTMAAQPPALPEPGPAKTLAAPVTDSPVTPAALPGPVADALPLLPEPAAATPAPETQAVAAAEPLALAPPAPEPTPPPPPAPEKEQTATMPQITIKPGNSLWALARDLYGAGSRYVTLLEANRDKISDPELIYPGQVLLAPKDMEH